MLTYRDWNLRLTVKLCYTLTSTRDTDEDLNDNDNNNDNVFKREIQCSDALAMTGVKCFQFFPEMSCAERDYVRISDGRLFHMVADDTPNALAPISSSYPAHSVLMGCRCRRLQGGGGGGVRFNHTVVSQVRRSVYIPCKKLGL